MAATVTFSESIQDFVPLVAKFCQFRPQLLNFILICYTVYFINYLPMHRHRHPVRLKRALLEFDLPCVHIHRFQRNRRAKIDY